MYCCTALEITSFIILVLETLSSESRLRKRNGFYYKTSVQPTTSYESSHENSPSAHSQVPLSNSADARSSTKFDSNYYEYKLPVGSPSRVTGKSGYSIGSGLRSIAQGSANQAHSAVANQQAAAKQAAFIAKNTLAQTASQAAATAQAALTGKHVILQELEQQAAEAERSLSRELEQLQSAQQAAKLAQHTAEAAYNHVSVLTASVNNAKAVAESAQHASREVLNQLASQSSMVGQAKSRLEQVEEQLQQARVDYVATKEAALKAASLAAEAQVNASKAAAHATIGLHETASQQQSAYSAADESSIISNGIEKNGEDSYDEHTSTTATGNSSYEIPGDRHP